MDSEAQEGLGAPVEGVMPNDEGGTPVDGDHLPEELVSAGEGALVDGEGHENTSKSHEGAGGDGVSADSEKAEILSQAQENVPGGQDTPLVDGDKSIVKEDTEQASKHEDEENLVGTNQDMGDASPTHQEPEEQVQEDRDDKEGQRDCKTADVLIRSSVTELVVRDALDIDSFSAPATPNTTSSRVRLPTMQKVPRIPISKIESSKDVKVLASALLKHRKESAELQAAIQAKLDEAAKRRANILPEPRTFISTPSSIISPVAFMSPKSWKKSWSMEDPKEVFSSSTQLQSTKAAIDAKARLEFKLQRQSYEAEIEAKRVAAATAEKALQEKKNLHLQKLESTLARGLQNFEKRIQEMEAQQQLKHSKSQQHKDSTVQKLHSKTQMDRELKTTRTMSALQGQQHYDKIRASCVSHDFEVLSSKLSQSDKKRGDVRAAAKMRALQVRQHDQQTLERARSFDSHQRQVFQDKAQKIDSMTQNASKKRNEHLQTITKTNAERHNTHMALFLANDATLKRCESAKQERVYQKHSHLKELNLKRYSTMKSLDISIQRKGAERMLTSSWVRDMEEKAAISNSTPVVSEDIRLQVSKMHKTAS